MHMLVRSIPYVADSVVGCNGSNQIMLLNVLVTIVTRSSGSDFLGNLPRTSTDAAADLQQ